MLKYYVFHCSNGFCGCDEDFYKAIEDTEDIDEIAEEILYQEYCFAEPDERFWFDDDDDDDDEDSKEEWYYENLDVSWEEISKEEYEEETNNN